MNFGLLHHDSLAGLDAVGRTVDIHKYFKERGVVDAAAVGTRNERAEGEHVFADLNVGSVPGILLAADKVAELLDAVPVVVVIKLIGVAPEIEKLRV